MCVKIFSKIYNRLNNLFDKQEELAIIESLKENLKRCEEQRKRLEESLLSLRADYEAIKIRVENQGNKVNGIVSQFQIPPDNQNDSLQKAKENSDYVIEAIIECIQNATVLDSEHVEKTQVVGYFNNQLIKILSNMGIIPIDDVGILANPRFHRIENIVYTDIPEQSGIISQSLGIGFKKGDDCIVEQPVEVYKYKK